MPKPQIPSPIRKWTALKLEYLDNYLQAYVRATKSAKETYYVDAFAGCGECVITENGYPVQGSPWRALNAVPQFSQYHFVEENAMLATHLRKSIANEGFTNATVYTGDCNQVILREILPRIPGDVPCFVFLDPFGLQLHWVTIRALAAHRQGWKVELLILYPYDMAIARQFSLINKRPSISTKLTSFYGDECWKHQLFESMDAKESTEQRRERFVRLYTGNIRSLGYRFVEVYGPLYSNRGPLYHVVFASDHYVGSKIMSDVWSRMRFIPGELGYGPIKRPMTYRSRL